MNFVLAPALFTGGSSLQLLRLWGAARDRRHRIEIPEKAEPHWDGWRATLDRPTSEELEAALAWSVHENVERPSSVTVFVEARKVSAWSRLALSLDDAVDLASRPFRIFLENANADGLFLRAMLTAEERGWLDEFIAREWLVLETAGGITELEKRVTWARESESRLLRVAAIFDGDAVEPPQSFPEPDGQLRARLHSNSRKVLDVCKAAQFGDAEAFPHHVTRRRSIENYLPQAALERWANSTESSERGQRKKRAEALKLFPRRHEFNMKTGHEGDRKRSPPATWLPADRNTCLEVGFGVNIAMEFARVTNDELKLDGGFDEFRSFIHALRRRIS